MQNELKQTTTQDSDIDKEENAADNISTIDSGISEGSASSIKSPKTKSTKKTDDTIKSKPGRKKGRRKQYICAICSKEFMGCSDLRKHLLIHSDERPFQCDQCSKKFRQLVCLKNHIASIHETDKKYICTHCSKAFAIKARLRLHLRIHSGEKPYRCSICSKEFARGGQLRQHLVIHDGQKPYACDKCPSSFSSKGNLRIHAKTHDDMRDLSCQICHKNFNKIEILKKHVTSHNVSTKTFNCKICKKTLKGHRLVHMKMHENIRQYICQICSSQFAQKSQLNVHLRMHSGERPYRCRVCWQAFGHSSVLKLHIRKHTGEKPFTCILCKNDGVAFSQLAHLKSHMKSIHGKMKPYFCEDCEMYYKTKSDLQKHLEKCNKSGSSSSISNRQTQAQEEEETAAISNLRLLFAILLKKISTEERLKQLGFEKRLIDNVIIDALKLAHRTTCEDPKIKELERLRKNIAEFLEWTIPADFMEKIKNENKTVEDILEELANAYSRTK